MSSHVYIHIESQCFFSFSDDGAQSSQNDIRNPAKEKIKNKINLYNQGLIKTEELLSLKSEWFSYKKK